jgi:hypothetical protein
MIYPDPLDWMVVPLFFFSFFFFFSPTVEAIVSLFSLKQQHFQTVLETTGNCVMCCIFVASAL